MSEYICKTQLGFMYYYDGKLTNDVTRFEITYIDFQTHGIIPIQAS